MNSLEKSLLPSSKAPSFFGPITGIFFNSSSARKKS